jgi:hypothetical protein
MTQPTSQSTENRQGELFPLDVVRVETVLSRNPVHNLAKQGKIDIVINLTDESGKSTFNWQVSYNSRYGQPGPLAYKLDTLIINRRIEEAGRPVPKVIRLGSLHEICAELGISEGQSKQHVKRALLQNASAFVTAHFTYCASDKSVQTFEFNDTRYGVVLTGQKFPDGRKANAVYLVLHDLYRGLLDRAPVRPLDYDYLKALTPGAQRFYELISYQIYAAIKHSRPDARYRYSDYCTFAPQMRYCDWEHVRKQMYKLHRPHLESGYLAQVDMEDTQAADGSPDWWFWYKPGPKAIDEYNSFAARRVPRREARTFRQKRSVTTPEQQQQHTASLPSCGPDKSATSAPDPELVEQLVANELNRADAERLAGERPDDCRRQLAYLDGVAEFKSSRGAYLRTAIEKGFGPPKGYAAVKAKQDTQRRQAQEAALKEARQRHEEAHHEAYMVWLGERVGVLENSHPEVAMGFKEAEARTLQSYRRTLPANSSPLRAVLADFERPESRIERLQAFLQKQHSDLKLPDFWQWDAAHNPERFAGPERT